MLTEQTIKFFVRSHSLENPKEECCGLLIKTRNCEKIISAKNSSIRPEGHFSIAPKEIERAEQEGEIVGFYHSHLTGNEPSEEDYAVCECLKLKSIIYYLETDRLEILEPKAFKLNYIDRPFLLGVIDCLTLIRDYYKYDLNIIIKNCYHPIRSETSDWGRYNNCPKIKTAFKEYFIENDFVEVNNLKKNDVILTTSIGLSFPCHSLIYKGNNRVLHHPIYQKSLIEKYSGYWQNRMKHIMRHKKNL